MLQYRNVLNDDSNLFQESGWDQYKHGFGDPNGDIYWMGLEKMHQETSTGNWQLLIVVKVEGKNTWNSVVYDKFEIGDEANKYKIQFGSILGQRGFFENEEMYKLTEFNDMLFSTKDQDNDKYNWDCVADLGGGWWYKSCLKFALNTEDKVILKNLKAKDMKVLETFMGMREVKSRVKDEL